VLDDRDYCDLFLWTQFRTPTRFFWSPNSKEKKKKKVVNLKNGFDIHPKKIISILIKNQRFFVLCVGWSTHRSRVMFL
jgi:hypothetical protein